MRRRNSVRSFCLIADSTFARSSRPRLQLPAGQHTLDLTPYAAGTYFLRAGGTARKMVVR